MSTSKSGTKKRGSSRKQRSSVTARRFFDLVVLVLGEKSDFTANTAISMAEVQDEVLRRADLTDKERKAHDEKYLKRRIEFAFRNRREQYVRGMEPLTVLVDGKGGQWGLTDAGVAKAKVLAGDAPAAEAAEVEAAEVEAAEVEEPVAEPEPQTEDEMPSLEEVLQSVEEDLPPEPETEKKPKRQRTRGPRTLSEAIGGN